MNVEDQLNFIMASMENNQREIQKMRGSVKDLSEELKSVKTENLELEQQLKKLNETMFNKSIKIDSTKDTTLEPKVADPEFFTGQRKKTRTFLLQLQNVFFAQPDRYHSSKSKVSFSISFLRCPAM